MFKVPEKYRIMTGRMGSNETFGNNGFFVVPVKSGSLAIIASDGLGWEHVSVHFETGDGRTRTPTWGQMCQVKDLFWGDEDTVIQYHPKKSEYVNVHPNTLHLWRPTDEIAGNIPLPPLEMV